MRWLIALYLFFFCFNLFAQKLSEHQKKALFVLEFANEFQWPKHQTSKLFNIGVLGNNPEFYDALIENSAHGLVKSKPIKIVFYKSIEQIDEPQILYLNGKNKIDVHSVFKKIKGKETLLVSENLEDFNFSMINFIDDDGELIYSVNKNILKQEGFTPSESLMEFAIDKESSWRSAFEKINEHHLVDAGNVVLNEKEVNEINTANQKQINEISKQREQIARQINSLTTQSEKIKLQEEDLKLLNIEILLQQKNLEQNEKKLIYFSNQVNKKKEELEKQTQQIEKQKSILKSQNFLIENQKKALLLAIAIILVIFLLLIMVIRFNQLRKKANKLLSEQNEQLFIQKNIIEHNHKQITDSLNYAHLIQEAVLPSNIYLQQLFPHHFIYNCPRDIVGGDFYWCYQKNNDIFFITADCTGHGVPGGFMSMLGSSLLNEIVIENNVNEPAEILNTLRKKIISNLKQSNSTLSSRDGMDLVALKINTLTKQLTYSAANNPFWLVRNNESTEFTAQKMPIGFYLEMKDFTQQSITLEKGDCIYTFSDGYADQFGGPKGKKFKYKPLCELLTENSTKPFNEQLEIVNQTFLLWKAHHQQVDDVLVIGFKIS